MTKQDTMKQQAAQIAINRIPPNTLLGIGTGSTVNFFIAALPTIKDNIIAIASSSEQSTKQLEALGFTVTSLHELSGLDVYVDGADEITAEGFMIKGGGAALTREKIVAAASAHFICVVDQSKHVSQLGQFPLPVEVIPMAANYVAKEIRKLGGDPVLRDNVLTDNGNVILDIHHFMISDPLTTESVLNNIVGVVTNGIFAQQAAQTIITGTEEGAVVQQLT